MYKGAVHYWDQERDPNSENGESWCTRRIKGLSDLVSMSISTLLGVISSCKYGSPSNNPIATKSHDPLSNPKPLS